MPRSVPLLVLAALACQVGPGTAAAQTADSADTAAAARAAPGLLVLPTVGGAAEEAARLGSLRGAADGRGLLLRSPSSGGGWAGGPPRVLLVAPEIVLGWNSKIPFSLNDGALWAGRGASARGMAGLAVQAGPVRLVLAPELTHTANAAFDTLVPLAWRQADPESFFPDWQTGEHSIDLPYRMGEGARTAVHAGQSSLTVRAGAVELGAATENQWWGPGIRNALVLSNQAEGFGHLFLRTSRALPTALGTVEARWISGMLRDSEWYARSRGGGVRASRSLSAAAVVLSPVPTLSIGLARSVHAPADGHAAVAAKAANVFTRWGGAHDSTSARRFDQITSLFGRLVLPGDGAEMYAEWARTRLPSGPRDLLEAPEHTQGYTLGFQWLRRAGAGELRIQAEHTYVEEAATWAWRETSSWYASRTLPQGYTHRGQVLGASVGPGASGQWLALDWLRGRGRGGAFLGRVRWAEDAYYDKPGGPNRYLAHDVSVFGGVRAALPVGPLRVDAEYAMERRWNLFFQNDAANFLDRQRAVNVSNHVLRLGVSAAAPRLGPVR